MQMNPTLLHSFFTCFTLEPRLTGLGAELTAAIACELYLFCTTLLYDPALLRLCRKKSVFWIGYFLGASWAVLMSHVMLSTTKLFLETRFFILQSPYHAFFSVSSWFTTSFSHMLHFLLALLLPFNLFFWLGHCRSLLLQLSLPCLSDSSILPSSFLNLW